MSEPVLSVVMITYNHEPFIAEAIEGVLMQKTTFPIELVIGEDRGTDGTRRICEEYAEKYPEIVKLLDSDQNHGPQPNFIRTYSAARGKYIAMCEGDDFFTDPNKLQKQVDFLEANPNYVLSTHRCLEVFGDESREQQFDLSDGNFEKVILEGFPAATLSYVFRKSEFQIPDWFASVSSGDLALCYILTENGGKIKYSEEIMGTYRVHSGGMWSSAPIKKMGWMGVKSLELCNAGFDYKYDHLFKVAIHKRKQKFQLYSLNPLAVITGKTPFSEFVRRMKIKFGRYVLGRR